MSGAEEPRRVRARARLAEMDDIPDSGAFRDLMGDLADPIVDFSFGDVHARGTLTTRDRELVIVAMLTAMGGCEPQLGGHLRAARAAGVSEAELEETIYQALPYCGVPRTINAMKVLRDQQEEG